MGGECKWKILIGIIIILVGDFSVLIVERILFCFFYFI